MLSGCGSVEETICKETEGQERNGNWYTWFENGQIKSEENYKDSKKDGNWYTWFENGQIESEGNYKDSKKNGNWYTWFENGQIQSEANWKDGKIDEWTRWNENGIPVW